MSNTSEQLNRKAEVASSDAIVTSSNIATKCNKSQSGRRQTSREEESLIRETEIIGELLTEAAEEAATVREKAAVMTGLADTPRLTESGIAPEVLEKLLPDEEVIVLPRISKVSGGLFYRFTKRAFDVVACSMALIVCALPIAVIAIKIKRESEGPVFYAQRRVGRHGKVFKLYKFRSMYIDAEALGARWAAEGDPRVTPLGQKLRKTRLDEIPQFWNVIKGDIPLRILKTRPEFSEKSMGAFALPAKSSTNKGKAFSQVVSCFANGLRMRRISKFNCNRIRGMEAQFLAKPVFGAVCA